MTKYSIKLFLRIATVVLFSVACGYFMLKQPYWVGGVCALAVAWAVRRLLVFQKRNTRDMKRLISAIQFLEFNISFENFAPRGLSPELIPDMGNAIAQFNNQLKKMEAEQNFYNTLLNRIDFGVMVLDGRENISWINKPALDLFDRPQPRKLEDLHKYSPEFPQILRDLRSKETKIVSVGKEKTARQLAATAIYLVSEGRQLKVISLKNIQSVLDETESEAWKKLIRVLTHEIMNSITPIISLAETFATPNEETQALLPQAMQTIHRRSKGLVDFVHRYQKLARIPNPTIAPFGAAELMSDITQLLQSDGLNFSYTVRPPDLTLNADRGQMEQVMINLIKNACEAAAHHAAPQVTVEMGYNEHHRPTIKVTDNGEGILPEALDKIFIPFFTTKPAGSGIGLSICRQIVNLHGGTIFAQSEVEKGSCFWVVL